jgi:hypothetical protein
VSVSSRTSPIPAILASVALVLAACSPPAQPPAPTPEPFTALHVVRSGPYPLYEKYGEWLDTPVSSQALAQLHSGCLFDVQSTSPDQQDPSTLWAYGKVYRCDEQVTDGPPAPQMGVRPLEVRVHDGRLGYFPMRLLEPVRR